MAVTAGDKIEQLRQWASGRCLSADRAGMYSREQEQASGRVRRVVREASSPAACPRAVASRGLPTFPMARAVMAGLSL